MRFFKEMSIVLLAYGFETNSLDARTVVNQEFDLVIADTETIGRIESAGWALSSVLGGQESDSNKVSLLTRPAYASLVATLKADLIEERNAKEPKIGNVQNTVTFFDVGWLEGVDTAFELIAMVNRFDLVLQDPEHCGELRFIYRLHHRSNHTVTDAKNTQESASLPFFLSVSFPWVEKSMGDCGAIARQSALPHGVRGDKLVKWLLRKNSIYRDILLGRRRPRFLEVNFQSSLWRASAEGPRVANGQYLLRSFQFLSTSDAQSETLRPIRLVNTPDRDRLLANPILQSEFVAWLRQPMTLERLDRGIVQMPEEFLAEKVISTSPFGLSRSGNRLTGSWLSTSALKDLDLRKFQRIQSPAALLRRLDGMSCVGCHQSRSIAGFHTVGFYRPSEFSPFDVAFPFSGHMSEIQEFRSDLIREMRRPKANLSKARYLPFAEHSSNGEGGEGYPCGMGDFGFSTWTCKRGLRCSSQFPAGVFEEVGFCYREALSAKTARVGDPCDVSRQRQGVLTHLDELETIETLACEGGREGSVCGTTYNGFPGGICSTTCDRGTDRAACIRAPALGPFSACLDQSNDFRGCLSLHSTRGLLPRCRKAGDCRDDYVCARSPEQETVCVPPYFVPALSIQNQRF